MDHRRLPLLLSLILLLPGLLAGQAPGYVPGPWRQVETQHFIFLYPEPLAEWTLDMARRMEAVHQAVTGLVGYAPENRVTVLVDDPGNVSNGSMNPGPLLYVWPTPPDPRSMIGENRGWAEILAVHEFAHAAHLTRPTRNPFRRFLWGLAPLPLSPMMTSAPRWITEGYATYVEGILTGSGRPHGVWRPAVLRSWALEGQIPTYGAVSGTGGYLGGAMAYLVGSAFVEWLEEREGGERGIFQDLWARMTARQTRSFPEAFSGVFGAPPDELYGFFTVEVTEQALAVRRELEAAGGVVDGDLFQRLSWTTGDPALSPDGMRLALTLSSEDGPTKVVVISTEPDTVPTREREALAEMLERDPDDVAPVRRRPRAQKPEATLWPDHGQPYGRPRWLPEGEALLVTRSVRGGDGRSRPELFRWELESGEIRQITREEAIREADPAPDGSWAVATRCLAGRCDLVRVDLSTGAVTTLARGGLRSPYARPRLSPDGGTMVASRQVEGRWRLVALDMGGGEERILGPDDGAARFDAEFLPDGRSLVVSSTRGGIPNLEILKLAGGGVRPLTRVLGAAVAPAPGGDGKVTFLSLHSRGWDLRRIPLAEAPDRRVRIPAELSPAAPVGIQEAPAFPAEALEEPRSYGLGPRFGSHLPLLSFSQEGYAGGLAFNRLDPIGRFTWQLKGMFGEEKAWRGVAAALLWRSPGPWLRMEGFAADGPLPREAASPPLDSYRSLTHGYLGGMAALEMNRSREGGSLALRLGGSGGRLEEEGRNLVFGSVTASTRQTPGRLRLRQSLSLSASTGRTGKLDWSRWLASGTLAAGGRSMSLILSGAMGFTHAPISSPEAFQLGGTLPLLLDPDLLSQRIFLPALPPATFRGDGVATARLEVQHADWGSFFYWTGDLRGDLADRYSLLGTEMTADANPVPYLRIPATTFRLGSAYLLNHPGKGSWRWWLVLGFRP